MKVCNKLNQIDYVNELKEYKSENLCVKDGRIVLEDDKKEQEKLNNYIKKSTNDFIETYGTPEKPKTKTLKKIN